MDKTKTVVAIGSMFELSFASVFLDNDYVVLDICGSYSKYRKFRSQIVDSDSKEKAALRFLVDALAQVHCINHAGDILDALYSARFKIIWELVKPVLKRLDKTVPEIYFIYRGSGAVEASYDGIRIFEIGADALGDILLEDEDLEKIVREGLLGYVREEIKTCKDKIGKLVEIENLARYGRRTRYPGIP